MDKIKALEYFIAAVEEGSFARAAQRLEISVPAVQKVVRGLERSLNVSLLERTTRGVRLTSSGAEYIDRCRPLLAELDDLVEAERRLKGSTEDPTGMLAVAAHPQLAHHVLLPRLARFHERYPDVDIDLRIVNRITDVDAATADVLLLHGWPDVPPNYVHRKLGGTRSLIMAAPGHWAVHGIPQHPSELSRFTCLVMRNPAGILLDLWEFARAQEAVQVPVKGWLSSNAREALLDLVIAGDGVGRFTELTTRGHVQSGRLVPVLLDWEVQGGPPINLLFKGSARRTLRLRAFVDYALECVRELQSSDSELAIRPAAARPTWHVRGYGRASAAVRGRR